MGDKTEAQLTAGSAGLIGLMAFAGALVGLVLQLLVAYFYGASQQTDAYFMAISTSELLGKLLLGGSITAVFLPMFVERLVRQERRAAWQLALNLMHATGLILISVLLLLGVFAAPFVRFIAPGFDADTAALTASLIRVMLPAFLFYFLADMATSMLHAMRQFTIPALLRVIAPAVSIVLVAALAPRYGIYALALGTTFSAITQFAFLGWGLWRQGFRYELYISWRDPSLRQLLYLVYPFIFSALATQAAGIVYRILVSDLSAGSLSALKYAEKITQLLTIIFLNSITTVIYPLLSAKVSQNDMGGMRETMSSALRLTIFLTVPIIIGVAFLRQPIIGLIYQHGSFTPAAAELTSTALLFLVLGLTTNAISSVLGHATLALQQSRAVVAVTICSHAVAIFLFVLLVPRMALAGLALGSSLVPLSSALLYYLYLRRHIAALHRIFWHSVYFKIASLAACLWIGLYVTTRIVNIAVPQNLPMLLTALIVPSVVGTLIFFGGAYLWKVEEMHDLWLIAVRKVVKWRGR